MRFTLLSILVLFMVGCASGGTPAEPASRPSAPTPTSAPPGDPAGLIGAWRAVELSPATLVVGSEPKMSLRGDKIGLLPGCNTAGGDFRVEGSRLITDRLMGTKMACEDGRMSQEDFVVDLIAAGPQWSLSGDRLTLSDGERRMVLERVPDASPTPS